MVARFQQERADQLKALSSQLFLFEARLIRKQKDISNLLSQRDVLIARQQQALHILQQRLVEAGIESPLPDVSCFIIDSPTGDTNLDSLNDSDSAVVLEEGNDHEPNFPRFRSGSDSVTIIRSVSDAVEPGGKYYSLRRSNGFLRRPEVLETVYSVEEDGDTDGSTSNSNTEMKKEYESPMMNDMMKSDFSSSSSESKTTTPLSSKRLLWSTSGKLQALYGSFERLNHSSSSTPKTSSITDKKDEHPTNHVVTTYNRVMSNHRSVTKPKDVKYKRINKAKSKSLEELRGRLKNWVDKGSKSVGAFDHADP